LFWQKQSIFCHNKTKYNLWVSNFNGYWPLNFLAKNIFLSVFVNSQKHKNILLLFLSKQNKTTKCKNKKQVFVFVFVNRQWHKNILLLFLSKQNKTTKCKNKKQVFVFVFVNRQWHKNILLLFLSKQNKTTKCKNKKQVFVFFFVSPWGNDLSLSAFCCSLFFVLRNKEYFLTDPEVGLILF